MICASGGVVKKALLLLLVAAELLASPGCFKRGPEVTQSPISISLTSTSLSLTVGQSTTISASVYDQSGQGVTWSVVPLNFGALSNQTFNASTLQAAVTYTAPTVVTSPTTVTVTATSITNPNIASSISFQFSPIKVAIQLLNSGLPLAPQTVSLGEEVDMLSSLTNDLTNAGVTWSLSPATGAGALTVSGPTIASYFAPASVSAATNVIVTATSVKDPSVSASAQLTVLPSGGGPNVVTLSVDGGPIPGQIYPNGAFTSITVCNPGSATTCQTIDGILVDTASYGLRIFQSQIPLLKLPVSTDAIGNTLENCATWPNGSFLWGPVSKADVYIGGESASSLTGTSTIVQVIDSTPGVVPDGCSNTGVFNTVTPQLLGANGILGIGPEPTDCTLSGVNYCDGSSQPTPPNVYYACPSTGCTTSDSPVVVGVLLQVSNPIALFASDRNGVMIQLPSVSSAQASASGTMTFGIGTESNNNLGNATVYTLDASDDFTTILNGQSLASSYLDTGSNALYFPDSLPTCSTHTYLYCPSTTTTFSATLQGATQGQGSVTFSVDNADSLFSANSQDAVFGTIAGPAPSSGTCQGGAACIFDWGLPFFYGQTIFEAIDGQNVPSGTPAAPWWAY